LIPYFDRITPEFLSRAALDQLLALGWYRMHQALFTCSHVEMGDLYRVHWLRYPVAAIKIQSSHKKIKSRNRRFSYTIEDFTAINETHAVLHARYRASIDFDGALSIEECLFGEDAISLNNIFDTKCISVFDQDRLVAAGYFDVGENSAASILHFFDPDYARHSLGKHLILLTVDYLRARGITWYYPGYVVEGLGKMNYKLFLGKDQAQYFAPEIASWNSFNEGILVRQPAE